MGRALTDDERKALYEEFKKLVNVSPSRLQKWLETEESKSVGWKNEGESEAVGHKSGKSIVAIQHKKKTELTDHDFQHMQKVVSYIKRHLAQKPHKEEVETSRWRYSLLNWGHDPLVH